MPPCKTSGYRDLSRGRETTCKEWILIPSQFVAELLSVEIVVMSALAHQFCVASAFGDLAILDHDDSISALDRRETVGNDETGAAFHHGFHALLNQRFGEGVY